MNSRRGSITLFSLFMLLIVSTITVFILIKNLNSIINIQARSKTYLCFKYQVTLRQKYIVHIAQSNRYIALLFPLTIIPQTKIFSKSSIRLLQMKQRFLQFSFMKKIINNSYCSFQYLTSLANTIIYKKKRNIIGQLELKKKSIQVIIKKEKKWDLFLKAQIKIKSNIDLLPKVAMKELFEIMVFRP